VSDDGQSGDGGQRLSAPVYEMLWNCEFCGAQKLLGKTHRHCPQCGAAQDPSSRYFPPDDEKVAVQDHVYFGVDWKCESCQTPNSNASAFCGNCGNSKDGAGRVKLAHEQADKESKQAAAPPPEPERSGGKGKIIGCCAIFFVAAVALFCAVSMFWTKSESLTVAGHSWERTIQVEEFTAASDADWCDDVPAKAYDITESRKERETKKIPDGQDCKTKNVDNGDGTFRQEEECTPRYREEPVYDEWCKFTIDKWTNGRVARASGQDLSPSWPDAGAKTCTTVRKGCQREGARSETYTVTLKGGGDTHTCDFPEAKWRGLADGATVSAEVSMVSGGLQCSTVK
jgi:hypothetical protein